MKTAHLSAWLTALLISLSSHNQPCHQILPYTHSRLLKQTTRYDTTRTCTEQIPTERTKQFPRMLSSNFLGFLAMASFALTSATAAALKQPRAAADSNNSNNNNKICSNTFYSAPQCCIPNESALDTPDCITRKFLLFPNFFFFRILLPPFFNF
jgi:hypothetical protein